MPYLLPDGRTVTPEMSFELGDVIFPPNAIKFCSQKELDDYEIQWVDPEPEPQPQIDLAWLKGEVAKAIDSQAEEIRMRFVTPGAGMAMTYQEKLAQARAARLQFEVVPGQYPLLDASVGIEADDAMGVARLVVARYDAWLQIGAQIERTRLAAKKAVAEAPDVDSVRAAGTVIDWGL